MMRRWLDALACRLGYVRMAAKPAPLTPPTMTADGRPILRAELINADPLLHDLAVRQLVIRQEIERRQARALEVLDAQAELARMESDPREVAQ